MGVGFFSYSKEGLIVWVLIVFFINWIWKKMRKGVYILERGIIGGGLFLGFWVFF